MITDKLPQRANGTSWRPGEFGNPNGRPTGSRNAFTPRYWDDLTSVWAQHGRAAMEHCATHDPSLFFGTCSRLLPKDVAISITERTPGGLDADDWSIALEVFAAIKQAMPEASQRQPGEVLQFVLDAIRSANAIEVG